MYLSRKNCIPEIMTETGTYHIPVLLQESVDRLNIKEDGVYVDVTFGGGGHSKEILRRLGPKGKLISFDQDIDALSNNINDDRFFLVNNNFRFIHSILKTLGIEQVDGILADLGVSSHHFDTPERGFSFRHDVKLDMRMNQSAKFSALNVVNDYDVENLARVLGAWGELQRPYHIATLIEAARPIETVGELISSVENATPKAGQSKFYAKLFQAIRIEVNGEMRALEGMLKGAARSLKSGGIMSVITYHSLEDRMVKNFFRSGNIEGKIEKDFFGNSNTPFIKVFGDITPGSEEISTNSRSRSARLRSAMKK